MTLPKSVVITIFHLFELLNAENVFLYICLLKVLRNNALFIKPKPIASCFKDFEQAVWIFLRVSISQI